MQPEDIIECFACEMHDAVQCKYCQSKSFCLECLKRYKKWHIQPFLMQLEPQETAPPPDLGHTVTSLQQTANEVQVQLKNLQTTSNETNEKWKNWSNNWTEYEAKLNHLLDTYEGQLNSTTNLEIALNREKHNHENDQKWTEVKRTYKNKWIAEMDEKWTTRQNNLQADFKQRREREWKDQMKKARDYESRTDAMKSIWDELEEACWNAESLKWKRKWDKEVKQKWELTEKLILKKKVDANIVEWDIKKDRDNKRHQNKTGVAKWKVDFKQLSIATKPADMAPVIDHTENLNQKIATWLKNVRNLGPAQYYHLTQMTLKKEEEIKVKEEEIKVISERRLKEEVERQGQLFQTKFTEKSMELEVAMSKTLDQHKAEIKCEMESKYCKQYDDILVEVLNEHQRKINILLKEIEGKDTAITKLIEEIDQRDDMQLKLKKAVCLKDEEIHYDRLEMEELKKQHQQNLNWQEEQFKENLEIAQKEFENSLAIAIKEYEHSLEVTALKLETKLAEQWKQRELVMVRLNEVLKKRVEEKNDQINRLLIQVRRDQKKENEKITEARLLINRAIDPMLEIFAEMVQIQEQRFQTHQILKEETAKLLDSNTNLIANYKQQLEQSDKNFSDHHIALTLKLTAVENLQVAISKNKPMDRVSFRQMLLNEVQIKLPGNTLQLQRYLQENQTHTQENGNVDAAVEQIIQLFDFRI